jgi:hypothetical protein
MMTEGNQLLHAHPGHIFMQSNNHLAPGPQLNKTWKVPQVSLCFSLSSFRPLQQTFPWRALAQLLIRPFAVAPRHAKLGSPHSGARIEERTNKFKTKDE